MYDVYSLYFFITESFRRNKTKAQVYDSFREAYWKSVHKIMLEVVRNHHIENRR